MGSVYAGHSAGMGKGPDSEHLASLAVCSQVALLAATLMLAHAAARRRITWIGDAGIALLLGLGIGLGVVLLRQEQGAYAQFLGFHKSFFFLAILPPIMFEAGHRLDVDRFFDNLDGIAAFAFAGTAISTAAMGGLVWGAGALGLCLPLPPLHALLFGSIVSATDPVTVLAVFQRLGANPSLYALVFGESVLNDAVAMVLYRTLSTFLHTPVSPGAVAAAAASFLGIFAGSMLVGCAVALGTAALVRTKYFRSPHAPLESSLVVLFAYASYVLADGLGLSGIVSVLFCGMFAAKYVRPNLAAASKDRVSAFFKLMSTLAETFVFLYIGAAVCVDGLEALEAWSLLPFLAVSFGALAISRALNIWPCAALVNCLRPAEARIPQSHQFVLWWSGLRGAMAFAIALEAAATVPGSGKVMLSATYVIIMATVLVNGGSVAWMLERLGLKAQPGGAPRGLVSVEDGLGTDAAADDADLLETLLSGSQLGTPRHSAERPAPSFAAGQPRAPARDDWKADQLRHAIRSSGLLRQLTLENSFLASALLDPAGPDEAAAGPGAAPSIAGDIAASRVGSLVGADSRTGYGLPSLPSVREGGPAGGELERAGSLRGWLQRLQHP